MHTARCDTHVVLNAAVQVINISLGWIYLCMGVLIGSYVQPLTDPLHWVPCLCML